MEYRQVFGTFPNNNVGPYGIKIESSTDEPMDATFGNMNNYIMQLYVNVGSGDPSLDASVGYFYSTPNGKYKVTYKLIRDGIEQERTELMDFWKYPPPAEVPPSFENLGPPANNEEEEHYPSMRELEEAATTPDEKRMYKLLGNYQLEHLYKGVRDELAGYIERFWPALDREIIVFRGQKDPMVQEIKTKPRSFFSATLHELVATSQDFLSYRDKCCLFVLHIQPGVKYFSYLGDINKAIARYNKKRETGEQDLFGNSSPESEILIEGGGQFFQDKEKTRPGFREMSFAEMKALGVTNVPMPHKIETLFGPKEHVRVGVYNNVQQTTGVFEAYYFPAAAASGGSHKRNRKTKKQRQTKRRSTRRTH